MNLAMTGLPGRAMLSLGVVLIGTLALSLLLLTSPRLREAVGLNAYEQYSTGQRVDNAGVISGEQQTLVVFFRSSCPACQQAKPQLKAILALAGHAVRTGIVLVPTDGWSEADQAFVQDVGLGETNVRMLSTSDVRLKVVPTLLLIDKRGKIQLVREGIPTPQDLETFRKMFASTAVNLPSH